MSTETCSFGDVGNVPNTSCSALLRTGRFAATLTDYKFSSQAAMKDKAVWDAAIEAKDLFVFPVIQTEESANTEAEFVEGATITLKTKPTIKRTNFQVWTPECIQGRLESWDQRAVKIFEITESNQYKGIIESDGKVSGQKGILSVDIQTTAVGSENAFTTVGFRYSDPKAFSNNPATGVLDFSYLDLQGIVDVTMTEILTSTSSLLNIQVKKVCNNESVTNLVLADFEVVDSLGAAVVVTTVTYNATNDAYELASAAAFANGDVVGLDGVVAQPDIMLESPTANKATISAI